MSVLFFVLFLAAYTLVFLGILRGGYACLDWYEARRRAEFEAQCMTAWAIQQRIARRRQERAQ